MIEINDKMKLFPLGEYLWSSNEDDAVALSLSHDGFILNALFYVREKEMRRMVKEDNGPVWTDSCVELFLRKRGDEEYCNFEFSVSGAMLAGKGRDRNGRILFDKSLLEGVKRQVTILENNNHQSRWKLDIQLDLSAFDLASTQLEGNAYSCGDGLTNPRFIALFPIESVKPDFHQSRFFQEIHLL